MDDLPPAVAPVSPRRLLFVLLVLGAALRLLGMIQSDLRSPYGAPLEDDSFYYFVLGRNLASGAGPTVDPSGPTNGFQPFWGVLSGVAFAVTPSEGDAVRLLQATGAAAGLAAGAAGYALLRAAGASPWAGLVGASFWLLSPLAVRRDLNGMETSLALLLLLLVLRQVVRYREPPESGRIRPGAWRAALLGLLLGMAFLARVDAVVLAVVAVGLLVWERPDRERGQGRRTAIEVAAMAGTMLLAVSPWILFSWSMDRPVIPESGQAVRQWSLLPGVPPLGPLEGLVREPGTFLPVYLSHAAEFTAAWARQAAPLLPILLVPYALDTAGLGPAVGAITGVLVLVGVFALLRTTPASPLRRLGLAWILLVAGLTAAYGSWTLGSWFYDRYAAPVAYVGSLVLVAVAGRVYRASGQRRKRGMRRGAGILLVLVAASWGALMTVGSYRWMVDGAPDPTAPAAAEAMVVWMEEHVPPGARVGAFQSGYLAFRWPGPVHNLDGKVDPDARAALAAGTLWSHMCHRELEWFVDWSSFARGIVVARSRGIDSVDEVLERRHAVPVGVVDDDLTAYRVRREACPAPGL